MFEYIFILLACVTIGASKRVGNDAEETIFSSQSSYSLDVEHAFGVDGQFSYKGTILFQMLKSTTAKFSKDVVLDNGQLQKLEDLVRQDGFYMIRAPSKIASSFDEDKESTNKDSQPAKYVSTFVKACHLYGSQLSEMINVAIDHSGNVIGISIVSPKHDCILGDIDLHTDRFNSTINVQQQIPGPVPDTQTFIKKMEKEKADKTTGTTEHKSFLAKYWMYILPVVLIVMLSNQGEPEGGGGGGGN